MITSNSSSDSNLIASEDFQEGIRAAHLRWLDISIILLEIVEKSRNVPQTLEILKMIVNGYKFGDTQALADKLGAYPNTIKFHLLRYEEKLGFSGKIETPKH